LKYKKRVTSKNGSPVAAKELTQSKKSWRELSNEQGRITLSYYPGKIHMSAN